MIRGEPTPIGAEQAASLLDWYALSGVDAAVHETRTAAWSAPAAAVARAHEAISRPPVTAPELFPAADPTSTPKRPSLLVPKDERVGNARAIAAACDSLTELETALRGFDGCALKETAKQLCFADGSPSARLMIIGEAPGAEEDRQGKPFVGPSGQLLDTMLGKIGLDRTMVWITNVIYWRPPGNRQPTSNEIAVCQPFLERQIELLDPAFILFVGGIAAKALLERQEGVTRLRGHPFTLRATTGRDIPCLVTFHPAYLLRQPLNKRFVWRDLLQLRANLDELGVACG